MHARDPSPHDHLSDRDINNPRQRSSTFTNVRKVVANPLDDVPEAQRNCARTNFMAPPPLDEGEGPFPFPLSLPPGLPRINGVGTSCATIQPVGYRSRACLDQTITVNLALPPPFPHAEEYFMGGFPRISLL